MVSNTPDSVPSLCHKLWELEEEFDLLDMAISDVHIWQACRMHLYYILAESTGLYRPPHVAHKSRLAWLKRLKFLLKALTLENPFLRTLRAENAIFPHTRSRTHNGRQIDVYSDFLCRDLLADDRSVVVFERAFLNEYAADHSAPSRRVSMIDSIASIASIPGFNLIPRKQRTRIKSLESAIQQKTGVKLDLTSIFSRQLRRFQIRRYLYGRLLDLYGVKVVYLVVSYYLGPLIDACKQRQIPVYELQHGVISTYHLGYSFPGRSPGSLQYFPDFLLEWGGKWPNTKHLPLDADHRVSYGFPYFESNAARYASTGKRPDSVLIVSQTVHGNDMARFIRDHIDKFEGWHITYKLHPSEANRAHEYRDLLFLRENVANFEIAGSEDVHALLARSQAVVGVFSTMLYEALAFGCDVYVCQLSGWEYMEESLQEAQMRAFENFQPMRSA